MFAGISPYNPYTFRTGPKGERKGGPKGQVTRNERVEGVLRATRGSIKEHGLETTQMTGAAPDLLQFNELAFVQLQNSR